MRISDWSSDVCSSDLLGAAGIGELGIRIDRAFGIALALGPYIGRIECPLVVPGAVDLQLDRLVGPLRLDPSGLAGRGGARSEERREGKECVSTCRYRWSR